jgi:hypothetical protein
MRRRHERISQRRCGQNFVIDDYQTNNATNLSSSGAQILFDVQNVVEDRLDDNNLDFVWNVADPFNGATQGQATDTTKASCSTGRHGPFL